MSIVERPSASRSHEHAEQSSRPRRTDELLVTVVIPCLNEAENIERCVTWRSQRAWPSTASRGEVVVADNGSEDGSRRARRAPPARASSTSRRRGYGSAYLAGFAAARGELHRDGRRRPDLRLRRDPALRRASSRTAPTS